MSPKGEREPAYYDPNWVDPLEKAKKKYFESEKGKAALRRYFQSEKGKAAFRRQYAKQKLVKRCAEWLGQNPGKTVDDFLKLLEDDGLEE